MESQRQLSLMGVLDGELRPVDWAHILLCDTEQAAFRLCINQSRVYRSYDSLADLLGYKNRGDLNRVINCDQPGAKRVRYMPRHTQETLQQACGNTAIDQWAEAFRCGVLNCQRAQKGD